MKKVLMHSAAISAAILLGGCAGAAFNRVELESVRNVSVGQELLDLQAAHEKGIISDTEYIQAKNTLLQQIDDFSQVDID